MALQLMRRWTRARRSSVARHRINVLRNLAVLRRIALSLLKHESDARIGLRSKRLRVGRNNAYLLHIPNLLRCDHLGNCGNLKSCIYSDRIRHQPYTHSRQVEILCHPIVL